MLNTQPAEKPVHRDDGALDVHSIFYTIQGEGPWAGTPAVFVRLAGCSLQCPLCDSLYTEGRRLTDRINLQEQIAALVRPTLFVPPNRRSLVVFTGGEPFRQYLYPVVRDLLYAGHGGYRVQVETNGIHDPGFDICNKSLFSIICSPKTPTVHNTLQSEADAFKYVLEADYVDEDGLPTRALGGMRPARPNDTFGGPIFVQPCDEKDPERNKANVQAALDSCMKHGYRLSLQTHKLLGLD